MIAIDTNVLVYAIDQGEPQKRAKAVNLLQQLHAAGETVLLWQVAGEYLAKLRKWEQAGQLDTTGVEGYLRQTLGLFSLALPSVKVLERAIELGRKYSLSHWDSMVIAACIDSGIDTLYTEDMSGGGVFDGVRLLNPFT